MLSTEGSRKLNGNDYQRTHFLCYWEANNNNEIEFRSES